MPDNMGKNGEGYPDPTAGSAWRNIRKEENRRDGENSGDQQPYSDYETDCGAGRI